MERIDLHFNKKHLAFFVQLLDLRSRAETLFLQDLMYHKMLFANYV